MGTTTLEAVVEEGAQALHLAATVPPPDEPFRLRLNPRPSEHYRADVTELAAFVLKVPRQALAMDRALTDQQTAEVQELIRRRAEGVPIGYLTGVVMFGGVQMSVGPGVFVPRVENELILAHSIQLLDGRTAPIVVDLTTASGSFALALAQARPDATVHGVDIDPVAIDYAHRNNNAQVARGNTPVTLHQADVTIPGVLSELDGSVDLLFSDPPFMVDEHEMFLASEYSLHQPATAIFGGPDGLRVTRATVAAGRRLLRPGGVFIVEHSKGQEEAIHAMLQAGGHFTDISTHHDYDGWPLYVTATRTTEPE